MRAETFGFDSPTPWALPALELLFSVPRAYVDLVEAWDRRHPGVKRTLNQLVDLGFVGYQAGLVVDVRTGRSAKTLSKPVNRWRTTAAGKRLAAQTREDVRVLEDRWPKIKGDNVAGVAKLLEVLDLDRGAARWGLSAAHAVELSGLAPRSGRWWIQKFVDENLVRAADEKVGDRREIVPPHWRITKDLCQQLVIVFDEYPEWQHLKKEFRLQRSRFLDDIEPARISASGATDFDHDVEAQRIVATLLGSPGCAAEGVFAVEPRIFLAANQQVKPWQFSREGTGHVFYQPDALLTEIWVKDGVRSVVKSVVEYERFQTRRDGWAHIERFCGYLANNTLPFEDAVLRFVLDSEARLRSYVSLIEAFSDYALDYPSRMPRNNVVLAVTTKSRLKTASDPLDNNAWFRVRLPNQPNAQNVQPLLHATSNNPHYDTYFGRR